MKRRVVIVEDDKRLREALRRAIDKSAGYTCVDHFGSGEMALKLIPYLKPDLVLMDIELSGMSGIECTARLKRELPSLQILILTSFEDSDRVFEALKAGVCGYLVKWDAVDHLVERIDEVFSGQAPISGHIARKVVQFFQQAAPEIPKDDDIRQLSPRELAILEMIAEGYIGKEIADKLEISFETVRTHTKHIYEKLHVRSRAEAAAYFSRQQKS